jgi:D-alanine-D-alanine ligase
MLETRMIANETLALQEDSATGHKSLCSLVDWKEGDVLCSFSSSRVLSAPTRYTLQLEEDRHILLHPEYLWYVNHSCSPNIFFDTGTREVVCLRPIAAGEEICFFYPSTEWRMEEPFRCLCPSPDCLGMIRGAEYMPEEVLEKYRLTPYILRKRALRDPRTADAVSRRSFALPAAFPGDLMVWVLVPRVLTDDPNIGYYYDFSQSIAEYTRVFGGWDLPWRWQPVGMDDYREVIQGIAAASGECTPLVLNLCDGDEVNGCPGISVIHCLRESGLCFTGADAFFYEATTSKLSMKELFVGAGVPTPAWEAAGAAADGIFKRLGSPLIVKPAVSAGSMGISIRSVVDSPEALAAQVHALEERYRGWQLTTGGVLAEQFVMGPEYTTLIVGPWDLPETCRVYLPVQRVFHPALPKAEQFLSFDRLWEIYETESPIGDYEDFYTYGIPEAGLIDYIKKVSLDAYLAVKGTGYGRVDLRMDGQGRLQVLEVNAQCGLSEDENYTSIGAILRLSGISYASLVEDIITDALKRKNTLAPAGPPERRNHKKT